ncbi:MAG TPA: response regulator transcription factor [Solirubrobacteraceae bacterium]|nr:response regulator transcription factor [Solirubrobacteraceae bacterium]
MSATTLHLVGSDPEPVTGKAGGELPVTVVVGDDHPAMRSSLRSLLADVSGFAVVAEAGDLALTRRHVEGHRPDVLVLDLRMPDGSSMETISDLRKQVPCLHVVVVSVDDTPGFAQQAMTAGASGYVLKDRADEDLPRAVAAAACGEEFVSEPVAKRLAQVRQSLTEGRLSSREAEVLRLIALGHTSSEIAKQLSLSPRTIETHRAHIHRKLGVKTRAELVGYALRCRLLET